MLHLQELDGSLGALEQYMREVKRISQLTSEEEAQLLVSIKCGIGAQQARDRLIEGYQPMLIGLARRFVRHCRLMEFLDLVQEGNQGLLQALEKYDESKESSFRTFAFSWVRVVMLTAFWQYEGTVRLPLYLSMILGANFSPGSGPEIPLNVSLLLRFGGQVTTKKWTTWLFAHEKESHRGQVSPPACSNGVAQTVPETFLPLTVQRLSPQSCCLPNVCRRPLPRSRLPVRVAAPKPRQVKAAQEEVGRSEGALVLALTGVAHLSSRAGGSYPLLGTGAVGVSAGREISVGTPWRSACCSR